MKSRILPFVCLFVTLFVVVGLADDTSQKDTAQQQMPPMGPPAEMKDISWLVGDWDVTMMSGMDPDTTTWTESKASSTYKYILSGAAMQFDYKGDVMGKPYVGMGVQCFDRETGLWQVSWIDDLGARLSLYTGKRDDGSTVVVGADKWAGQDIITRIITYHETPDAFDWKMEYSTDGGKTYLPSARARYIKRQ
jgi:hypothetical protein